MEFDELENVQNHIDNTEKEKKPAKKSSGKFILTTIGAAIVVVLVVILCFFIIGLVKSGEGKKTAEALRSDLGKSIAMAEKNSGITLSTTSEYSVLKDIVDYDYIYEASTKIKVGGIQMPKWAVFVKIDGNAKISDVVYYNFNVLKKNWKGQKTSAAVDTSSVTYNMTKKETDKLITVTPLAVTYSNDDTSTYLYKYYYVDEADGGNERAYYLLVTYSMDDIVRGIDARESDYVSFIFK